MVSLQKENEWEKKWNDGVRPCAWDEVADFITAIVSTREKEIADEVEKLYPWDGHENVISKSDVISILKH